MRVLVAGPGDVIACQRPLAWLLGAGCEVWFLGTQNPYPAGAPGNYHYVAAPIPDSGRLTAIDPGVAVAQLQDLVEQIQPTVIHAHNLGPEAHWCAAAGVYPLILSVWGGLNSLLQTGAMSLPKSIANLLTAAQALIVESPALEAALRALYPVEPPRIELIPLGVDPQRFKANNVQQRSAWRRSLNISDETVVLLSPRGWGQTYNQELILRAFVQAKPKFKHSALLLFVRMGRNNILGEAEACYNATMAEVELLGMGSHVRVLPALRHELMPSLYALADVVVNFPSADAFPSTLVEAAACERPIVTARLPSYAGTFIETYCTLVQPNQPQALAEALVEIVNQPLERQSQRLKQMRHVVVEQYDERKASEKLLQLYQEYANGKTRR